METLEHVFRIAAVSQLIVLALVLLKDYRDRLTGILVAAWALSGVCYLSVVPVYRDWHWETASMALLVGSLSWPVLFWLVAKALFQDGFRFGWWHALILFATITISLASGAASFRSGFAVATGDLRDFVVPQVLALLFTILAMYVVLKDWQSDLVEPRRKLRLILLAATGIVATVTGSAVFALRGIPQAQAIQAADSIHVGLVLLLCLATNLAFFRVQAPFIEPGVHRKPPREVPVDEYAPVVAELNRLMDDEKIYCERGLTIGALAAMLGEKEYRLRRIINGESGYRNFNDFLNHYRTAEAADRLIAPESRRLPVLTIALDVGYSSIGPFNRAFKQKLGMTPTEYRASTKFPAA